MKKLYIIAVLLLMMIVSSSCTPKNEDVTPLSPKLVQAESIMYEHLDSALHILQEMPVPAASSSWA